MTVPCDSSSQLTMTVPCDSSSHLTVNMVCVCFQNWPLSPTSPEQLLLMLQAPSGVQVSIECLVVRGRWSRVLVRYLSDRVRCGLGTYQIGSDDQVWVNTYQIGSGVG